MAAAEIYDYVSVVTADYTTTTLNITAQGKVREEGRSNQVIHRNDDNTRETITLGRTIFYIYYQWNALSETDAGTIFDFYFDDAKAKQKARTFKLTGHDGHTYVVWFDCDLTREGTALTRWGFPGVSFEVKGKIADA